MKVVFLQIKSYLLSQKKTNPLFDPIIEACDRHGIQWEVWLREKHLTTGYPAENVRSYCWRDSLVTAAFLLFNRVFRLDYINAYRATRFLLRLFHVLDRDVSLFVTNTLAFVEEFAILYPSVPKAEVQHGIIYPSHFVYFGDDGVLHRKYLHCKELKFWLFGQGYKDCFFENETNKKELVDRISIVGDLRRNGKSSFNCKSEKKLIVIASQLVCGPEFSTSTLKKMKQSYEQSIREVYEGLKKLQLGSKYKILFRHHPRFGDCVDLSNWKDKYSGLIMDDARDWDEIYPETKCLLTLNSTSAFDAAAYGVPTIIIDGSSAGVRNILVEDFHYPYGTLSITECLQQRSKEYENIRIDVFAWYQRYYETFTTDNCLRLLEECMTTNVRFKTKTKREISA